MTDHEQILRKAAVEIRAANINGWGNACEQGADRIRELEAALRESQQLIADAREQPDDLYVKSIDDSIANFHIKVGALLGAALETPEAMHDRVVTDTADALAQEHFKGDKVPLTAPETGAYSETWNDRVGSTPTETGTKP